MCTRGENGVERVQLLCCCWPVGYISRSSAEPAGYRSSSSAEPADYTSSSSQSSSGCPSSSEPTVSTASLLERLHRPRSSELARKRTVHRNPPPLGKRRSRGRGANEPKSVTPSQRVAEHPGECLTTSNKQLFCRACREELSLVSSTNNHLKSTKHR